MSYKAPSKAVTIHGEVYTGLNISGSAYAPVNRRIESAHKHGGYSMVRQDWPEIFGIKCCEIEIEIEGKRFIGTAEVNLGFGHPISDAQTSALGRALAAAGYDVEHAVASAEDMEHAANGHMHVVESDPPALPDPWEAPRALAHQRGYTPEQWKTLTATFGTPERALTHLQNSVPAGS